MGKGANRPPFSFASARELCSLRLRSTIRGGITGGFGMEWMLLPYKRYFDFSGRSRRKEYWMFTLLFVIVYVVCAGLMFPARARLIR